MLLSTRLELDIRSWFLLGTDLKPAECFTNPKSSSALQTRNPTCDEQGRAVADGGVHGGPPRNTSQARFISSCLRLVLKSINSLGNRPQAS